MHRKILSILIVVLTVAVVSSMISYNKGWHNGAREISSRIETEMEVYQSRIDVANSTIADYTDKLIAMRTELANVKRLEAVPTSRGGFDRTQIFTITAYSPYDNQDGLCSDDSPNNTATGTKPKPGTIAVDPKVIPYGSAIVVIYDDGTIELGKAEDCGGLVKGNHIDVFRNTYAEAIKFGRQKAVVMWYKEEKAK